MIDAACHELAIQPRLIYIATLFLPIRPPSDDDLIAIRICVSADNLVSERFGNDVTHAWVFRPSHRGHGRRVV